MNIKLLKKQSLILILAFLLSISHNGYGQSLDSSLDSNKTVILDCGQGDDSNNFENGKEIAGAEIIRHADDFDVAPNSTLNIRSVELNIMTLQPINTLDLTFYNDDNGSPGSTVLETITGLEPYAQVPIGFAFNAYSVYTVMVEVDLTFEGGASGAKYWMEPVGQNSSVEVYWEINTSGTLGKPIHGRAGGPWIESTDGAQGVFKLHCEVATPPPFECMFDINAWVEPITRVVMADVDNTSSPTSTLPLEDFTSTVINAEVGASIDVALEGNTEGPYDNFFTVFINTAGTGEEWSTFEAFEIGSINGSTGTDGQQATATITLPNSLEEGEYLLRVVKNFNVSPLDPCVNYAYGQAEDYTLNIGGTVGVNDFSNVKFTYYPNPMGDELIINSKENIETISAYNLLGQEVLSNHKITNGKVNVSELTAGTYIFKITFENGITENFKVVKK
ncbi:T9SS type A sorting domain-containing protein [Aequorivita sp. KMM 9714]|uniref:T9SS type A sorting domain-containing protein n=1 Tax=Aequorivita sp. KMM 9714 TaxID=2707173 RepID=UPI0013EC00EC|nr:T9SS type A sorting domain-containing protein [Aequorivita sp. KMM 9714]NGX84341.1 T9SS type A sorting domain-containing protein [Aequorivita sp. KMM 9714]